MSDHITISKERYKSLLEAEMWRIAMRSAGVDNWERLTYAMDKLQEMLEND